MDAGLHEELPDWMSQLFEKLDLEANRDDSMCTMKVAQGETHPLVEGMLDIESNEDDTLFSMAQGATYPLGCISPEILTASEPDSATDEEDEELVDWMMNMGDGGGRHYPDYDMPDEEFYPIINKEAEYYKRMKRVSQKKKN
ncbi:hypothetical protein ACP70R_021605 [Stipagrostis hirtigluma subsp. patula]